MKIIKRIKARIDRSEYVDLYYVVLTLLFLFTSVLFLPLLIALLFRVGRLI